MTLSASGAPLGDAVGIISIEPAARTVAISGRVVALADGHYDAALTVKKSGRSGTTNTTQKGSFDLGGGESADVAHIGVSFARGDRLTVRLEVSEAGRVIWQTTSGTVSE